MFITPRQYTIRPAAADDIAELERLAVVDSQPSLGGPVLLAEFDGRIAAAVAMVGGRAIADPFLPTAALVVALRNARANHLRRGSTPSVWDRIVATLVPPGLSSARR
jgi:hypothetical protein